jgi:hypothetical protein
MVCLHETDGTVLEIELFPPRNTVSRASEPNPLGFPNQAAASPKSALSRISVPKVSQIETLGHSVRYLPIMS